MIKPNWDVFKAKFSENPQFHFEWFCYLLFCKETKNEFGVFRYKNQSAIETDPVDFEGHSTGFQAKFYDTNLSNHKDELIETLVKARRDYPDISKIYLYSNKEWGQAFPQKENSSRKAKKSIALSEIEQKADELNLIIEWRTTSYFESPFVSQTCVDISKYFFVEENSLLKLIDIREQSTNSILKNIKQSISFEHSVISIERTDMLNQLENSINQVTIVSGKGGVGKTVEVKKLYEKCKEYKQIFAFKASEFEVGRLNDLANGHCITDMLCFFDDCEDKVVVIDSAEKLMDLTHQETIKEFIDLCVENGWRIIFTTRDSYLDDLNFLCIDFLGIVPIKLYISELGDDELSGLAEKYKFKLPTENKLLELLKIPFYLNAYLKFCNSGGDQLLNFKMFKSHLWNKKIKNGEVKRECVFIDLALQRANSSKFYLSMPSSDIETAEGLMKDEVLGVNGSSFFISHDIYEEWALEKFIDVTFRNKLSIAEFYTSIGHSLAIRRSFRSWMSEQIYLNHENINNFIEQAFVEKNINSFWRDELTTAILLSQYSSSYFDSFETELLKDDSVLLKRVIFLLRISCKEIDNSTLKFLGLKRHEYGMYTKPKGNGWKSCIDFIFNKKGQIGLENMNTFMPLLYEWCKSNKRGNTTRKVGLMCLEYYKWLVFKESYSLRGKIVNTVVKSIAYCVYEIKNETSNFIDEICLLKEQSNKIQYKHFVKLILTDFDGIGVPAVLPESSLKLAKNCWLKKHERKKKNYFGYRETEEIYGVVNDYEFSYHPDSALQTPIFYMLSSNMMVTVDFVLEFINKVTLNLVNHYGKENFKKCTLEVDEETSEIYIVESLWATYRGSDNAPNLVKSILMALEKHFIENADKFEEGILESWLKYLLRNTNSTAICGVVTSIVLANQDRLFEVAKILFKVSDFIQFDNSRVLFDRRCKSELKALGRIGGRFQKGEVYRNERLTACDQGNRQISLESLCLYYQVFGSKDLIKSIESQKRQKAIWEILDTHYEELKPDQSESLQLWRMCLARMDRRKMTITADELKGRIELNFSPELEPDLIEMSESVQKNFQEDYKFLPLSMWANYKIDQNKKFKEYDQYESTPKAAVADLIKLIDKLMDKKSPPSESFILVNKSTHIYTSAALIIFHHKELSQSELEYCVKVVESQLELIFSDEYYYQIGDGMKACFIALSTLWAIFPEKVSVYKKIIISGLMRADNISMLGAEDFSAFSIQAVNKLWKDFDLDVQAIFWGFLTLFPLYREINKAKEIKVTEIDKTSIDNPSSYLRLLSENEEVWELIIANDVESLKNIDFSKLDLRAKSLAICLLPNDTSGWTLECMKLIVESTVNSILDDNRSSNYYLSKTYFLKKLATYLLHSEPTEILGIIQPIVNEFKASEGVSDLLEEFVLAQDLLDSNENFWVIWNIFKPEIINLAQNGFLSHDAEKVIKSYLFAHPWWKKGANNWHGFKGRGSNFFAEMADKLSRSPSTLYSFAILLNGIGSMYSSNGISWLAKIIESNSSLKEADLDEYTIFNLNEYMRNYLYREKSKVRSTPELLKNSLVVLELLIEKGEVSGYLMRESIL